MLGEQVEIVYNGNWYDGLIGTVTYEDESYVQVKIEIANLDTYKVMFYKDQVKLYNDEE